VFLMSEISLYASTHGCQSVPGSPVRHCFVRQRLNLISKHLSLRHLVQGNLLYRTIFMGNIDVNV
jgi:hypothetical protein